MLLDNNIAIWDVIHSCSIVGSSDSSIKDVVVNDFSKIIENSNVQAIYVNGGKAYDLYHKYAEKSTGIKAIKLPSTSPANAAWSLDRLIQSWKQIKDVLDK
jgi:hypoxanthine-DNA glycosylase